MTNIKKMMTAGVILYGIAVLINLLCVLFQSSVFDFMNNHAVDINSDRLLFPLISIYQIVVLVFFSAFMLVMLKYKGSQERIIGIVMIVVYCIVAVTYPYISVAETWFTSLLGGEVVLVELTSLDAAIGFVTLPFVTVSSALMFIATGRFGVRRESLVSDSNSLNNKIKIPMIVGIILSAAAMGIDLFSFASIETVYKIMNAPDSLNVTVFPITAAIQIIFTIMFVVFLLIMLKYKGLSTKSAAVAMTVIYCLLTIAAPFIKSAYNIFVLNSGGADYVAAGATLENFIALCTPPFTVVSTVLIFIAIGRYSTVNTHQENNDNSEN